MFKAADPTRRLPVYLQNGTKENIIWQFKLLGVYLLGAYTWDKYSIWRDNRRRKNLHLVK